MLYKGWRGRGRGVPLPMLLVFNVLHQWKRHYKGTISLQVERAVTF